MANKVYRFKRTALIFNKKKIKAWNRPVQLIRKVGDLTCEGCFFDKGVEHTDLSLCTVMHKQTTTLPPCQTNKRSYIFIRINK